MKRLSWPVAAVAVLVLSGCDGTDAPQPDRGRSTSVPVDELALHDGQPCPKKLPPADVSTYGFGTSDPAGSAPQLASLEEAWVCVYGAIEAGPGPAGTGTTSAWVRTQGPIRVRPPLLATFEQRLEELRPADSRRACNADLGPRFVLVYRHGSDLTGVSVDDFGCAEVRLTDDPFTTVPGDATQGGTVPGVLQAPTELLAELKAVAGT